MTLSLQSTKTLNNGIEIPILGLGTFLSKGDELKKAILWALDAGYRHLDTASFYENEQMVGETLKIAPIPRDDIFITTKIWNSDQGFEETLKACDRSLQKLQLNYVDLLLIHWPVPKKRRETWRALEKLLKDGKTRAIGVSNYMGHHLEEVLAECSVVPAVDQFEITPFLNRKTVVNICQQHNISIEAYSPLTRGAKLNTPLLLDLAAKYKKTPAQILIRWGVEHGFISLPKSTKKERIEENANIFDFSIEKSDLGMLDNIQESHRVTIWDPEGDEWL